MHCLAQVALPWLSDGLGCVSSPVAMHPSVSLSSCFRNLISVLRLLCQGLVVMFRDDAVVDLDKQQHVLAHGVKEHGLFRLVQPPVADYSSGAPIYAFAALSAPSLSTWHQRFGHLSVTTVPTFRLLGLLPALPVAGSRLVITAQTVQPRCCSDSFRIQLRPSRVVLTARCYDLLFRLLLVGLVVRSPYSDSSFQFQMTSHLLFPNMIPTLIVLLLSQSQFR
jgi:hypothetical protein